MNNDGKVRDSRRIVHGNYKFVLHKLQVFYVTILGHTDNL